ncbi:photosystem II 11 kD protein PsbZ [Calothrix sp. NIES-4101]|nr:photosystem II 11 kD protein PsbZ [Calothrix sp. NIES-4101]
MFMKRYLSRLLSLVLVVVIGLMSFPSFANADTLTGNYSQDTLTVVNILKNILELPNDAPDRGEVQTEARQKINEFAARYQRNSSVASLSSFTTMRTALNSLAGHYSSYPNRPVPQKLKDRLQEEFVQVESALRRGA